ncbi:hypothetical protein PS056_24640, partial [Shigella sonnei]|nr:hypothetical protein [Shigella sonnei]
MQTLAWLSVLRIDLCPNGLKHVFQDKELIGFGKVNEWFRIAEHSKQGPGRALSQLLFDKPAGCPGKQISQIRY